VPAADRVATFRTLSQRCPAEMSADCARLYFQYLMAASQVAEDGKSPLTGLERATAREELLELLESPAVGRANVDYLLYGQKDAIGLLSDAGSPERKALVQAWTAALDRLGNDAALPLSAPEQLSVLRARVLLAQLDAPDAPLPTALLAQIRTTVARVDAETTDPYARQAAVNAAAGIYWEAGLNDDANRMLVAELEKSKSPYYFMLDLAELAKKAGHKDEAVQWLARAYEGARGPATRFQWGSSYLLGLIEMAPENSEAIEKVGLELLGELDDSPDAFYQRTRLRLEQLSTKLLDWGKTGDRSKVIESLRNRAGEICRGMLEGDEGRPSCEGFLNSGAPASQRA
jgi:hypothetical protein